MEPGNGIPGGGLPAGAARKTSSNPKSYLILKDAEKVSMTKLADGVWGWAGAEHVNASMAACSRRPGAGPKPQPCSEIVEKLFLGTRACAQDRDELKTRNIYLTIAIGDGLKMEGNDGIRIDFVFKDEEGGSLLPHFPKAFAKIREGLEDGGVLIFCESGQASTALTAAFLMADKGMSYEEAAALIKEKRAAGAVELNRNLSRQLTTWSHKWPEFPGLPDWM